MTVLPDTLAPWSAELAALDPGVAVALGPMIHRLDELVGRQSAAAAPEGVPDGVDGLAVRGRPDRLLVSQWLLASEVPDEFLRRAADGELLYLAPARQHGGERGQAVVLVDCGPAMLGAPRLVQLALAIVLARRAAAAGHELRLGVLGAEPGRFAEGDLPAVLGTWLKGRTATAPDADTVEAWLAEVDRPRDAWVVTTPRTAQDLAGAGVCPRLVTVTETDWTASGPAALAVRIGPDEVRLPMPAAPEAVRVLRGQGWQRRPGAPSVRTTGTSGPPVLPGYQPVLLVRGDRDGVLVRQKVPAPGEQAGKLRRHQFPGPVLAASVVGGRLVALVADDGLVRVHISGKDLAGLHRLEVRTEHLDLSAADVVALADAPPAELWFHRGALLVRLPSGWWSLERRSPPEHRQDLRAVVPSSITDACGLVTSLGDTGHLLFESGKDVLGAYGPVLPELADEDVLVGAGALAWQAGGGAWQVADLPRPWGRAPRVTDTEDQGVRIQVPDGGTVLGLARLDHRPALVVVSAADQILRLVSPSRAHVLSSWSGGLAALHACSTLVAVRRPDGAIEVGEVGSGQVRLRLEPT